MNDAIVEMGTGVTVLLILFGFFFQSKIFFYIQLIWLILISSLNSNSVDWLNNLGTFQVANENSLGSSGIFMFFYNFLAVKAKSWGMDYVNFNGILTLISSLLVAYVIMKESKRPTVVMSFIFIYPFIDDIIQKRWYYAMGVLIFGIYKSLHAKNSSNRTWILLLSAFIASQFHSGAIIFFSLPIFLLLSNKAQRNVAVLIMVIGTVGRNRIPDIVNLFTGNTLAEKATLYFTTLAANSTLTHYLFWTIWQLLQSSLIFYIYKRGSLGKNYSLVWRMNVWAMCIIPLYSFDPVFSRIFRVILIFNYITIANSLWFSRKRLSKIGLFMLFGQFVFSIVSFVAFDINSSLGVQTIVFDIFKYNQFLNWI